MDEQAPPPSPPDLDALDAAGLRILVRQLMGVIDELRKTQASLMATLAAKDAEAAELKRALLGPKSERVVPLDSERKKRKPPPTPEQQAAAREATQKKRRQRRERRRRLAKEKVEHEDPASCPDCDAGGPFTRLGVERTVEVEHVPERFVQREHEMAKLRCACGHIFTAPGPLRVTEGTHYGPGLHAHAVVAKCADSIPLHRLARRFSRAGVAISRSTLTDMFHRSAKALEPIYRRLQQLVAQAPVVNADETSQPVMQQGACRRAFVWTFIARSIVLYIFSATRSGRTPSELLGSTPGVLQVDGHTGYNAVTTPEGRTRAGCLAHCRRYFYRARDSCPTEADEALRLIREVYEVEYTAAQAGITGTAAHAALRKIESRPRMERLRSWCEDERSLHDPKSPLGAALRYTLNQWQHLTTFLDDVRVRLDNNISEGALRIIALGRDNFRWVGHDAAGHNLAILQSIVATCVASSVDPEAYFADVLIRVQTQPAARIDELLPMHWKPSHLDTIADDAQAA